MCWCKSPILRAPRGSRAIQMEGNYLETMTSEEWLSGFSEVLSPSSVTPSFTPISQFPILFFSCANWSPQRLEWLSKVTKLVSRMNVWCHLPRPPPKAQERRQLALNFQWYSKDLSPLNIRVCSYKSGFPLISTMYLLRQMWIISILWKNIIG